MLHEDALVISRHDEHLLHDSVKHGLHLCSLCHGDVYSIVCRQLQILEDRVELLAELSYYRAVHRPWEFALVLGEFSRKCYRCRIILRRACASGRRLALLLHGLLDDPLYFTVESLDFLLLGLELILILLAVLLELSHHVRRGRLIFAKRLKFLHSLRLDLLRILLHLRQTRPLSFQFLLHRTDLLRLLLHLRRQVLEISEASVGLPEIVAGEDIHIPYAGVAILVCAHHQTGIMRRERVHAGLQTVYVQLLEIETVVISPYLPVAFPDQGLPVLYILSDQLQTCQQRGALGRILGYLLVQQLDLALKLGLAALLPAHILRRKRCERQQQSDCQYVYSLHKCHLLMADLRSLTLASSPGISSLFFCRAMFQYTTASSYSPRA